MGKKKPIDPDSNPARNDVVSAPSDIFITLFGDVREQNGSDSIFSDKNPFKRKPHQFRNPNDGDYEDHDFSELKRRKRDKEEKVDMDSESIHEASDSLLETKKPKKEKAPIPNSGSESIQEKNSVSKKVKGKGTDLGVVPVEENHNTNDVDSAKEKRRKRKRDELEVEYEAKKYGEKSESGEGSEGKIVVGEKRKEVDNSADMLVSKEGFDDESKLLRTVFVGNLPLKVKKKALFKEFSRFGEVESVRIRSIPLLDTKKPRKGAAILKQINDAVDCVHAYIVFKTEESAEASLAHNMAVVGGHHIRVDRACPPRKKLKADSSPLYDNKRTVFVGNLPFDVQDEEIYQLFCGINNLESAIEAIRVIRDPHLSVGKGIAYVMFKTRDAANLVIKKRNLKLRDRELRLSHARLDPIPSNKRKNPSFALGANSPTKKLAVDSRTSSDSNNKMNTKADMSYQGLRARKSGVQKKIHTKSPVPIVLKSKTVKGGKLKERKGKRPAVAARKAKANAPNNGGSSEQARKKRKLENRTPDSFHRNKKAKKFK